MTATQLKNLDLPRKPGGPARATVKAEDPTGRRAIFDLYLITESVPTSATGAQLAAAAARRTAGTRACEQCGAHPESPCTRSGPWLLCPACVHIERLRAAQRKAAEDRAQATERAAELLADERLAILHVDVTQRGTTPGGTKRPPSAAHLTALDAAGSVLLDVQMRLVPPRSQGIPEGAVPPEDAAATLSAALSDRVLVLWDQAVLRPIGDGLRRLGIDPPFPTGYGTRHDLHRLAGAWRGTIDAHTGRQRALIPPGRADRMLHLLHQITLRDAQYLGESDANIRRGTDSR